MFELNGKNLTVETLKNIARDKTKISIDSKSKSNLRKSREFLEQKINSGENIYGINTGIGEFSETKLPEQKMKDFQKYLVYNHSAGIGKPMPIEYSRAALVGRVNVHLKGNSACRPIITETIIEMLNKDVVPIMAQKGSVGASGDLAPMAQAAQTMMGEGECYYHGERMKTSEAFSKAGITAPGLEVRDGLAFINGSNVLTGMSALHIYDFEKIILHAEIATAMSLEALLGNLKPYSSQIHELRGFSGAMNSALMIRDIFSGSDLVTGKMKTKLQDAYSMRSTPQVIGAARDALNYAKSQVEIELNGVCDNPVFIPDEDLVLSGANFQGSPVSLPMDMVSAAITMVCILSERRLNRLLNPALSAGLPPFLATDPGFFSGLMLSQYTADTLIAEQKILCTPASIQSIPAAADQEDFVSMGMNTALKNQQIRDNSYGVIGIELFAAAQALDFRDFKFGDKTLLAHKLIRKHVDFLDLDRPLHGDHDKMNNLVESNDLLKELNLSYKQ
ncbi:aromatic amino acid ammonia-lyase [Candidatus Kapabacteria bacterium]|nr:aromatic amino acid ammonia-lyase [Candidatus Kapabacteria bacterium]